MAQKKPTEYRNFEDLTKKLLSVPKPELDKQVNEYNARKERRKAKQQKKG